MNKCGGYWAGLIWAFCFLAGAGVVFADIQVPERLKDVPIYEGSEILQASEIGPNALLTASVKEKSEYVADFYGHFMKKRGWILVLVYKQEDALVLNFKKEGRKLQVKVMMEKEDGEAITYSLVVSDSPQQSP